MFARFRVWEQHIWALGILQGLSGQGNQVARGDNVSKEQPASQLQSEHAGSCVCGFLTSGPLCLGARPSSLLFLGAGTDPMK